MIKRRPAASITCFAFKDKRSLPTLISSVLSASLGCIQVNKLDKPL